MRYYLAPMEGITGHIYRQAYHACFTPMDRYMTPFIAPKQNRTMNRRELQDVLPKHNAGMDVVPQILTGQAADFIRTVQDLRQFGYEEVNLNLGCPSSTVVKKGKGAGFLAEPKKLEAFLEQIFDKSSVKISVKTRLGMEEAEEFEALLRIFNRFPVSELIIHARVREDFYGGKPRREAFLRALADSRCPVCYNGDIFDAPDASSLLEDVRKAGLSDRLSGIMLGRGVLMDPRLLAKIKGEERPEREALRQFHDLVYRGYQADFSGSVNVLFKMKELWFYLGHLFEDGEKCLKRIRKANRPGDYEAAVRELFEAHGLREKADVSFLQ